jgi:hypothetical protein
MIGCPSAPNTRFRCRKKRTSSRSANVNTTGQAGTVSEELITPLLIVSISDAEELQNAKC